ncbi:hypothetical protein QAD02_021305 [Eretmocerus hayati]|uniref:Uncharacterized protein n=1 Tax=Eretmocerus hayati TaxID=131215 RepID=A0ACC2PT18_9HYME|nr:hypothetical protein QAD02_021305 [Eretmocerus hayati]
MKYYQRKELYLIGIHADFTPKSKRDELKQDLTKIFNKKFETNFEVKLLNQRWEKMRRYVVASSLKISKGGAATADEIAEEDDVEIPEQTPNNAPEMVDYVDLTGDVDEEMEDCVVDLTTDGHSSESECSSSEEQSQEEPILYKPQQNSKTVDDEKDVDAYELACKLFEAYMKMDDSLKATALVFMMDIFDQFDEN